MSEGCAIWLTGMSGSGKSTIAEKLARRLREVRSGVEVLDGDLMRTTLCRGLGYSREDREENIHRIGFLCEMLARNGVITIVAAISPYRSGRDAVRARVANFIEVYMQCPLEVLIQRDVKGLYKRALAGEITHFTGISDPYEPPIGAEITIDSSVEPPEAGVERIFRFLEERSLTRGRCATEVAN